MEKEFKAGFCILFGRPNVGKSSLLNCILGTKLAIVSEKPQTTRNRILGVKHLPNAQIIFFDTPGIHRPIHLLNEYMINTAKRALKNSDVILFVVDAKEGLNDEDEITIEILKELAMDKPIVLDLNKIDIAKREDVEFIEKALKDHLNIKEVVKTSAITGEGIEDLIEAIVRHLPEGYPFYPEDMITDIPEHFYVSEIIREKIFNLTKQEIPYSTGVVVESIENKENIVVIKAVIYVEKESQKAIIIGKDGSILKKIGTYAREELEAYYGKKCYLELWVKVKEKWRYKRGSLAELGYKMAKGDLY
ncbi:MAG: GTPase Era [Thermosulfidibacteraceae bacterium]|jgi:GTP-binding protein Era